MEFDALQQTLEGEISKLVQTEIPKLVQTHLQPLKVKMEHANAHYEAVLALLRSTPEYQKLVVENKALRAELDLKNSLNISVEGGSNRGHVNSGHVNLDHVNLDHVNSGHVNLDHVNSDNVNSDHVNLDHVNLDHVNLDHVNLDHAKQEDKLENNNRTISISRLVLKVEEKVQIPNNDEDDLHEDEMSYVTTDLDDEFGSDAEDEVADACAADACAADACAADDKVADEAADKVAQDEAADDEVEVAQDDVAQDEDEVAQDEVAQDEDAEEEDDEEVFLFEHPTHGSFYTSSLTHGVIYEVTGDNDVGEQVGQFIDGVAVFLS
jgi:hypothetical protein